MAASSGSANLLENHIPCVKFGGIITNKDVTITDDATVILPATTTIGGSAVVALGDITSSATTGTNFAVTNTGIYTGTGIVSLTANSATTGVVQLITANGITSGTLLSLVSTGTIVTTGEVLNIAANSATTSTGLVRISGTGLTDGFAMAITSGGANLTASGGGINLSLGASTLGTGMSIVSTGVMVTTANLLTLTANSATTAAGLLRINANGLTSGIGAVITSSATAITGAGRLLRVDHTGATGTSAVLSEFASAATDETVVLRVTASGALAAGVLLDLTGAAVTTGTLLDIGDADALTTGTIANFTSNSSSNGSRTLMTIKNDNVAATGTVLLTLTQDAPTSTNYFKAIAMNGYTLWIGNGTTPNGNLSGTAGDWLIGGDSGKGYFCTGTTSWTAFA